LNSDAVVQLAAKRLIRYWNKRLEVFGPDRAFLPLTLTQALVDDESALEIGFARLVEGTIDPIGRGVMFVDPSKQDKTKYSRESMVRAMWYMIHAALEVESTQRYGLVTLAFPRNAKFSQSDRHLDNMIIDSLKGYLPVRLSAIHICHPPSFLRIIFPIIKMFLGERLRKRVRVHGGSIPYVLNLLADFGLSKEMLPVEIGGDKVLDQEKWLQLRKEGGK
jgi:CRAL/TRIO domain